MWVQFLDSYKVGRRDLRCWWKKYSILNPNSVAICGSSQFFIKIHIPLKWRLYCVIIFFVWFFYVFDAIPKWGALLLTYSFLWSRQFWKISGKILNISWWGFFMHNWTSHGVFSFTCFTFIHAKILLADSNIAPPIISQRKRLRCVVHFFGLVWTHHHQ